MFRLQFRKGLQRTRRSLVSTMDNLQGNTSGDGLTLSQTFILLSKYLSRAHDNPAPFLVTLPMQLLICTDFENLDQDRRECPSMENNHMCNHPAEDHFSSASRLWTMKKEIARVVIQNKLSMHTNKVLCWMHQPEK